MVRLKVPRVSNVNIKFVRFQFQYGSIKSSLGIEERQDKTSFQFQYGSIKSELSKLSGMVEFEFQFQYGSIKRNAGLNPALAGISFQFQYGSIKRVSSQLLRLDSWLISIPIWFD